jgi:hypothetical protein
MILSTKRKVKKTSIYKCFRDMEQNISYPVVSLPGVVWLLMLFCSDVGDKFVDGDDFHV